MSTLEIGLIIGSSVLMLGAFFILMYAFIHITEWVYNDDDTTIIEETFDDIPEEKSNDNKNK